MASLTHKQQAFIRPIGIAGMPTHRARLAGVVGIDFDGHTARKRRLVGDVGMQFSKG